MKGLPISEIPSRYHAEILRQLAPVAPRVCDAQPKPDAQLQPLGENQNEERSTGRFRVSIQRRGQKLLDKDNLYGSAKFVCDGLRYLGLIPSDAPDAIDLDVTQVKTPKKEERGTLIEITPL
jgi:hypothetical protein